MFDDLKKLFRGNNFIGQVIVVNAIAFVVTNLIAHLFLSGNESFFLRWLGLPSSFWLFIKAPWTVLTYMFMHGGLWHIVFNMYMLYWFGRIFNDFMGEKRLIGLYFMGGLAGGVLYLLVFNGFQLAGAVVPPTVLVGASAAVMAITIAVGARFPDYVVHLLFFGGVRLKYVALVIFLLSTVLDFSSNMGGKIAHLGGAVVGFLYARNLDKGSDFALGFYNFFARFGKWFERRPKLRVVPNSTFQQTPKTTTNHGGKRNETQAKTDAILDKISKSGYDNLTKEEKEFLFKLSNK